MSERGDAATGQEVAGPVTVRVRRRVKPGRETDYEAWLNDLIDEAGRRVPGFLGTDVHRPAPGSTEYTSVFRFDTLEHLEAFERSDVRAEALREVVDLVDADAVWDRYTGLELWFDPPAGTTVPQPSRLRMAILLTVVVYGLVLGIGSAAAVVVGDALPAPIRLFLVIAVEVALMTYLIMPWLTRRLATWIYPTTERT